MDRDMNILYILGVPLGYVMEWIYNLIPNYGWDIIIFTIVIRLLSIPLSPFWDQNRPHMGTSFYGGYEP